jgi:PKD repeat protein
MKRRCALDWAWPALAFACATAACGGNSQTPHTDAATDQVAADVVPVPDAGPAPLAIDFSVTGCATFDQTLPSCGGIAPLTLMFTPVASEDLVRFLWDFGDNTQSSQRSPTHTYTTVGMFRVTLAATGATGSGSVQQDRENYVRVAPAPAGAWCDVDDQCAPDLTCWCGASGPCSPVLLRGLCTTACDDNAGGAAVCPETTVCADLSARISSTGPVTANPGLAWRRPACLRACDVDSDCATGFRCRNLRTPASDDGWVRACFASYPLEIGARCGDDTGKAVDDDCASSLCADLGAFGRCSADCTTTGCPMGAGCAHFGDGRNLCLAACTATTVCNDDPLLACEPPGAPGQLGFTVGSASATPASSKYCAPKRCVTSQDCGPAGTCPTGGGNCRRNPLT